MPIHKIAFPQETNIELKYNNQEFYKEIPVFNTWDDYALEEIKPDCFIPVSKTDNIDTMLKSLSGHSDLIYRGHENPSWLLNPTLHRKFKGGVPSLNELEQHLIRFYEALESETQKSDKKILHINTECQYTIEELKKLKSNTQALWELGQHYGLYTSLLDWSENINKALFFAFEPEQWDNHFSYRAIYILNIKLPNDITQLVSIVSPVIANNLRMKNQEGMFTKILTDENFERIISCNHNNAHTFFRKVYILNTKRKGILDILNEQGINAQLMYTGLDGAIRYCNSHIYTRAYGGNTSVITINQDVRKPFD